MTDPAEEILASAGLEPRPAGERLRATYPRLIWPHLESHQIFVRVNLDGREVEAELSIARGFEWLETLAKALGRIAPQ